ncbi:hypothetical protein HC356_04945 [Wolbachia pipientis]|uniref:Uncharacterized protein n=1 Tax=Wolbachia pipientis TaxID=955 RepID=A0A7G5CED9_WOLPI|nr:hypothetical protein HC356_04945 [Wolbachia pipientis]
MPDWNDTCISLYHQSLLFNVIPVPLFLVIPVPRHWDPEKLIMYYTTFSIKSWIPVPSTGMTPLLGSFSYKH